MIKRPPAGLTRQSLGYWWQRIDAVVWWIVSIEIALTAFFANLGVLARRTGLYLAFELAVYPRLNQIYLAGALIGLVLGLVRSLYVGQKNKGFAWKNAPHLKKVYGGLLIFVLGVILLPRTIFFAITRGVSFSQTNVLVWTFGLIAGVYGARIGVRMLAWCFRHLPPSQD